MGYRIDQLGAYGSVNEIQSEDDLFEVSKNSGTPGSPIYATGDSKKITKRELINLLGGIPYSGTNYEVIKATGTPAQNGVTLLAAIVKCLTKTPNGAPLTASNRATVYLWSGSYDIPEPMLANGLINIVGVGKKEDIKIYSTSSLAYIIVVNSSNVVYRLKNLSISNASGLSIAHGAGIVDVGIWDDLIIEAGTDVAEWNGQYSNVKCTVDGVLQGSILSNAIVESCEFLNLSCGYSSSGSVDIDGKIINCTGIDYCFGYSSLGYASISGLIEGTTARDSSFGVSLDDSTGATLNISGIIRNCSGRNLCFIATTSLSALSTIDGKIYNCLANTLCFAYAPTPINQGISGSVFNCQVGSVRGLVHSSPNGHKWRESMGDDGVWQTEDLGI